MDAELLRQLNALITAPDEVYTKIFDMVSEHIRAEEKEKIIVNGKNRVIIEGYITKHKFDPDKRILSYELGHISTSVKTTSKYFPMNIPLTFCNDTTEKLSRRTFEGMYVETEAKLRGYSKVLDLHELIGRGLKHYKYTEYQLIGTHLTGAQQIKQTIDLPEADNGN